MDWLAINTQLEMHELGGDGPPNRAMLALSYIAINEPVQVKYLLSRCEETLLANDVDLVRIGAMAEAAWRDDERTFFRLAAAADWSVPLVAQAVDDVLTARRARIVGRLARAYSVVRIDTAAALLGLNDEARVAALLVESGRFARDDDGVHLRAVKRLAVAPQAAHVTADESLARYASLVPTLH